MGNDPTQADKDVPAVPESKDFRALRATGDKAGASKTIGSSIAAARDVVARALLACGATPNRITLTGFVFTCGAGYCLARGASQQVSYFVTSEGPVGVWPLWALFLLLLAGACDMLDGAVARIGKLGSEAGAVLDSVVDRLSDGAIYLGCFIHYATLAEPSVTYQLLAFVAFGNAVMISYVKARAENVIEGCTVGYWYRGERFAAVLIGCACGHMPAVLWQMAVSCGFTVWRRVTYAFAYTRATERGHPLPPHGPRSDWIGRLQLWRHPRGSIGYDLTTGFHIAFIIFAPLIWPALHGQGPYADPLRSWLGG